MKKTRKYRARLRQVHLVPPAERIEDEMNVAWFVGVVLVSFALPLITFVVAP